MLHFMQLAHPRHMDIYIVQNSKHKSQTQKSPVSNTEHKTSVYKTQCHIQASVSYSILCRDLKLATQFRHALNMCIKEKRHLIQVIIAELCPVK